MQPNSIGKVSPAVVHLSERISGMDKNEREYLLSFINDFYTAVKPIETLNVDHKYKMYLLRLIRMDYDEKIGYLKVKFGYELSCYMRNIIIGKLRNIEHKILKENKK